MSFDLSRFILKHPVSALSFALLLGFSLFYPGLYGGFLFDDEVNIVRNEQVHITSLDTESIRHVALSGNSSPLKRPISMLSFAANYYLSGLNPFPYKLTNLIIHLFNGIGIFITSLLIFRICNSLGYISAGRNNVTAASLFTATIWLIHPLNITTTLYVVQRMNSLSSMFVIYGMATYLAIRVKLLYEKSFFSLLVISTVSFTILAALSKENGILLPFYMAAFEVLIFRFKASDHTGRIQIIALFITTAALPVIFTTFYFLSHPDWILNPYIIRDFTLGERLLTESRVMWYYLYLILLPNPSSLGIFHDDFNLSFGLTEPISTVFSLFGLCFILFLILRFYKTRPLISFGLSFFLIGHSIESSFISLELVHEHRNYLPDFGILLILGYFLICTKWKIPRQNIQAFAISSIIIFLSTVTFFRSMDWGNPGRLYLMEATHHPDSPRANFQLGQTYLRLMEIDQDNKSHYAENARHYFTIATRLRSSFTDGLFATIQMDNLSGKVADSILIDELVFRLKSFPYEPNNINWINRFTACKPQPSCSPSTNIMHRIFNASLNNKSSIYVRSELYTMASKYAVEVEKNPDKGLRLIYDAANSSPTNPRYKIHVARLLILMNRKQEAHRYLLEAEKLDSFGTNRSKIEELLLLTENLEPINPIKYGDAPPEAGQG